MKLFVGLGNPGPRYAGHRHNVGYMVVDRIAADHGFGGWRSKFQGQVSEARLGSDKIMLLKPETFMNESGRAVGEAQRFHKLATEDVVVFHDEIDLAPGKMRLKRGGGHAGHNGLRSIDAHIGNDYHRVRIGVGHPGRKDAVHVHVLKDFSKSDRAWLEELLTGISDGAAFLADATSTSSAIRRLFAWHVQPRCPTPHRNDQRRFPHRRLTAMTDLRCRSFSTGFGDSLPLTKVLSARRTQSATCSASSTLRTMRDATMQTFTVDPQRCILELRSCGHHRTRSLS